MKAARLNWINEKSMIEKVYVLGSGACISGFRVSERILIFLMVAASAMAQQTGGSGVPGPNTGGSIPATTSLLKGSGLAGAASPAVAGTDYISPAPSAGQTVSQPSGTTFAVSSLNGQLNASAYPYGCTIGGTTYTTNGDCAFYSAVSLAIATNNSVDLSFGDNYYNACAEWIEPTGFFTVNLIGTSTRSSFINKVCSTPTSPVIFKGEPIQFGNLVIRDITIQANGKANSCMDLWGLEAPYLARVNCNGVLAGSDHAIQIGEGVGHYTLGGAEGAVIDQLTVSAPLQAGTIQATITPTVVGGVLTALSCGTTCGTYDTNGTAYIKVFFLGFGHGNVPCTTMPTANATIAGTAISSFTITNGGAGCTGTLDVQAYESFPINVGIELNLSDSTVRDIQSFVGTTAAITSTGGNTVFIHPHPTATAIGLQDFANSTIEGIECDTIAQYCVDFEGNLGTAVFGTNTYQASHVLPGSSTYYFGPSANYITFGPQGDLCTGQVPPDYHEFVTASGPIDTGAGVFPSGVSVFGNDRNCGQGGDYTSSLSAGKLKVGTANQFQITSNGIPFAPTYVVNGTTFSATGCSVSTLLGGSTAGSFRAGNSGACTVTITMGSSVTAPSGFACGHPNDLSTNSDSSSWTQTATTNTTVTLSGTSVSGDVINFSCIAY